MSTTKAATLQGYSEKFCCYADRKNNIAFGGSPGSVVGLASSWTASTTLFVPRRFQGQYARPGHGRARTPQFLLPRQRTRCCQCCRLRLAQRRLKSLCVFYLFGYLLNSPLGGGAKKKDKMIQVFMIRKFSGRTARFCSSRRTANGLSTF